MKINQLIMVAAILVAVTYGCNMNEQAKEKKIHGINLELMDTSVDPAVDFFRFVNGKWLDSTEVPADRGRWGSFDELRKMTSDNTLAILKKSMEEKSYEPGSDQAKAVIFYETAMDLDHINQLGIDPLRPELEKVDAITDLAGLQAYLINSSDIQ